MWGKGERTCAGSLNTQWKYGSSANAFCTQSTAPGMSDLASGTISIAIIESVEVLPLQG